ncbi:LLM class flavin-dependent oxidoreductase [Streptosporangium sp. NBC_01755]|uniref:LLM class flavin-dependent oxidoreductase n=1 Tax=unclassified Streptosporangium TaxID=2632669 RepID=UPI002DD92C81|nr:MULTISPECIES: LLM class flavin-dependent oxidoreductase [unclassified Streptosporangium]WSA26603.1 LLM class flavin-dependent oxidoreductase [Streptosporangium sp. NBC_01810]WSD01973.1 LLM class flavin-dependent oxidoreductase [Streptosporangium sp. NBC_01755]
MLSGVALQPVDAPTEFESMVEEIEGNGFDELWLTDSSLHARNVYVYLTLAASRTDRIRLGTAVTNPITRHPAVTATAITTVDEVSGGRAVLGIGAGDRPLLALGSKPAPLKQLEAGIDAIRRLWTGENVTMRAPGFVLDDAHMREPGRSDIPVYMSASGPKTLELAGRVADGVILLAGLHPEGLRWAIDHIERGAEKAGRSARPDITVFAYGAIDDDEDKALAAGRTIAAWFPQTAPVYCEMAGLSNELVRQVREMYSGGEFQEAEQAAKLLPDEFVHRMSLAGGKDRAREHIKNMLELDVECVSVFPLGDDRMKTVRYFKECFDSVTGS